MQFDPAAYGEEVSALLALDGNGERLMPLALGQCSSIAARGILAAATPSSLFPGARSPEAALCGLYLYFSCIDEAHTIAQDISSVEGSYWHAIVHRQEPDAGNAAYWFRHVGEHPIFPALAQAAANVGVDFGDSWDPFAFIDYCENVRQSPGSPAEERALRVQRIEWQLLFDHCAGNV
jgi:hypothetical protein